MKRNEKHSKNSRRFAKDDNIKYIKYSRLYLVLYCNTHKHAGIVSYNPTDGFMRFH